MKNLFKFSLVFLLLLTACSKDNESVVIPDPSAGASKTLIAEVRNSARTAASTDQEDDYLEDGSCFEVNYPYSVSDGQTTVSINNEDELANYLESLPDDAEVFIVYPLNVTLSDGTQQTINSEEEYYALYDSCYSDDIVEDCFTLNFPLTALDSQGNQVTVNSEQELYSLDLVGFAYPISVTLLNGSVVSVNSSDEFDSLYNDCYGIDDCEDCDTTCFEIVFPFSVVSQSGDLVTFSDYDQLLDFLDQLTENDTFVIQYPISVEFEDGTQQSVGSDEELEALYESCE